MMNTEYFWWLAALVGVAAGGLVVVIGWRDRGGLDALAPAGEPRTAPAGEPRAALAGEPRAAPASEPRGVASGTPWPVDDADAPGPGPGGSH